MAGWQGFTSVVDRGPWWRRRHDSGWRLIDMCEGCRQCMGSVCLDPEDCRATGHLHPVDKATVNSITCPHLAAAAAAAPLLPTRLAG